MSDVGVSISGWFSPTHKMQHPYPHLVSKLPYPLADSRKDAKTEAESERLLIG